MKLAALFLAVTAVGLLVLAVLVTLAYGLLDLAFGTAP